MPHHCEKVNGGMLRMNGKNGNNRTKILLVDLLEYIAKYQYARYIFSSHYNDECLNENVNKHTLRMNLVFKEMSIKFNPNQILLYNFMDFKSTDSQYVILDRVKSVSYTHLALWQVWLQWHSIDFSCMSMKNSIDGFMKEVQQMKTND